MSTPRRTRVADAAAAARRRARVAGVPPAVARARVLDVPQPGALPRRDGPRARRPDRQVVGRRQRRLVPRSSSRPGCWSRARCSSPPAKSLWPVVAGVKWIRFYHGMVATPIRAARRVRRASWCGRRSAPWSALGVPRRRRAARRDPVGVGRARDPRRRADRGRVLRAARRVLGDAGDRLLVPGDHAARDPAAVLVLGHVLPDLGAAELARTASRCSRRSGTASSSPDARPPATSRSGRCWPTSRSSSRSSSPAGCAGTRTFTRRLAG